MKYLLLSSPPQAWYPADADTLQFAEGIRVYANDVYQSTCSHSTLIPTRSQVSCTASTFKKKKEKKEIQLETNFLEELPACV